MTAELPFMFIAESLSAESCTMPPPAAAASTLAAVSIVSRVITSVAHQRVQFASSGYQRLKSMPPTIFSSSSRWLHRAGASVGLKHKFVEARRAGEAQLCARLRCQASSRRSRPWPGCARPVRACLLCRKPRGRSSPSARPAPGWCRCSRSPSRGGYAARASPASKRTRDIPAPSTVWPTSRPGICRTYCSLAAMTPQNGPP